MSDRAFLFADLAGFTALTEAHGDLDAAKIVGRFCDIAHDALAVGSTLVKSIGDAVMIVASEPEAGIVTALDLSLAVESEPRFPAVRVGLHVGSAVEQSGDFFGSAVNLAARIAAHARSGQILSTEPVAVAAGKLDHVFVRSAGQGRFKNVSQPVELFELEDRRRASASAEVDPVCRMRIDPDAAPARLPFAGRSYAFCSFDCARTFAEGPESYVGG